MNIQIIHYQDDLIRIRILLIQKPFDLLCPVFASTVFLGICKAPSIERFRKQEDAGCPVPNVFIIFVFDTPIFGTNALTGIGEELNWLLIHADNRESFVIRTGING